MYTGRKGFRIDGTVGTGINGDIKVGKDIIGMGPTVEGEPVVGSDNQHELVARIVGLEVLQGVIGIGRLGQPELVVGGFEVRLAFEGLLRHKEPQVVVEQVGRRCLERVERRDKEPHLVQPGEAQQLSGDGNMTHVDGIETAPKDTDTRLHVEKLYALRNALTRR